MQNSKAFWILFGLAAIGAGVVIDYILGQIKKSQAQPNETDQQINAILNQ